MKTSLIKLFKSIKKDLKYKVYYYKYFYQFVFAHKPLCDKFRNDTILLLNKIYICRSCLFLYSGLFLTLSFAFNPFIFDIIAKNVILILCFVLSVLLITNPKLYKKYSRLKRDIIRFLNGVIIGLTLMILIQVNFITGIFLLATLFVTKKIYNKYRSFTDICAGCSELNTCKTCTGYKKQVEALLILEENYSKTLAIRKELLYD